MATTIPRASDPWGTDFLLGFWNSAVAAELVVDGGRGDWLAPQDLSRMPFPRGVDLRGLRALAATPTAQEMERDPGRVDPSACPSHMLPLLVAFAARGAEEAMTEAVRACDVWYRGGGQRAADRKQCWQWIVHGQGPPPPPEIAQPLHRCGVHRAIVDASLRRIYGLLTG